MDVRPNIAVPDAETLKALLSHRFRAMTDYQRNVFMPALREEAAQAGAKLRRLLPRRLRRGTVNDGRWLKPDSRAQLSAWVAQRPRIRTLVEYRGAWPRCWKRAATMRPSACISCRPGATRPRKVALPRCRPTPRD